MIMAVALPDGGAKRSNLSSDLSGGAGRSAKGRRKILFSTLNRLEDQPFSPADPSPGNRAKASTVTDLGTCRVGCGIFQKARPFSPNDSFAMRNRDGSGGLLERFFNNFSSEVETAGLCNPPLKGT